MTEEIQALKDKIKELEKELEESQANDSFEELKNKYEKIIEDKDKEIDELNKTAEATKKKVDSTLNDLNDEVQAKLESNEKYKSLLATVEELQKDKAEATVDAFIQQGKILPAQKETALKLCLNDNDMFMDLYRDAQPIIEVKQQKSKKINADLTRLVDYFKN